jgi:hypothetical protein
MGSVDTFKTWASRITAESEIPDAFRATFRGLRLDAIVFPLVLFCPAFRFDRFESPPRLLVITERQIICLERLRNAVVRVELLSEAVHAVEWGAILLNGWIRFLGTGQRGPASIRLDFNVCSRELFLPLLDEFRHQAYGGVEEKEREGPSPFLDEPSPIREGASPIREETSPFDVLRDSDYKFMSYARETLRPGMEVRRHYLQSAASERVLGLFERLRISASMLIATQRELIVIREGEGWAPGEYGGVWSYIPLDKIQRLDLEAAPARHVIKLGIRLPGESEIACDHLLENEGELRAFVEELRRAQPQGLSLK